MLHDTVGATSYLERREADKQDSAQPLPGADTRGGHAQFQTRAVGLPSSNNNPSPLFKSLKI